MTDYDGNVYNTVQIGKQCWMKENLRTTHYADGTTITSGNSSTSVVNAYYYDYSSSGIPLAQRGYLYNWPAVMHGASTSDDNPSGVQGICPAGWHVPSNVEWMQLTDYVIEQHRYVCGIYDTYVAKALATTSGWDIESDSCVVGQQQSNNNNTSFSAVPAGYCEGPSFYRAGYCAVFWSSTSKENDYLDLAWVRSLASDYSIVDKGINGKYYGYSVRCLRD